MVTPVLEIPFDVCHHIVRIIPVKKKGGPREGHYRLHITDNHTHQEKPPSKRMYIPTLYEAVKQIALYTQADEFALMQQFIESNLISDTFLKEDDNIQSTCFQTVTKSIAPSPNPIKSIPPSLKANKNATLVTSNKQLKLSSEQQNVLKAAIDGTSLFFTGSAGTGKSFLLREIVTALQKKHGKSHVYVTAPTGIAACNVGGITLHSFASIGLGKGSAYILAQQIQKVACKREKWKMCKVLVIDEVSMLDGHLLDKLNIIAQCVRCQPEIPFGGIQLVLCGDFYQLPPVGIDQSTCFAFESELWKQKVKHVFQLTHIYRQSDPHFIACLNDLRMGIVSNQTKELLSATEKQTLSYVSDDGTHIRPTKLYSHNANVDQENEEKLHSLPGACMVYKARDKYSSNQAKVLDRLTIQENIKLKIGAQVLLLKNINVECGLANGTRGVVIGFGTPSIDDPFASPPPPFDNKTNETTYVNSSECKLPIVRFFLTNGDTHVQRIEPEVWKLEEGSKVIAERMQIPLRLAWALSIHKAQGMTIELLETNVSRCFDYGQCYVALSRAVSLEKLRVMGFDTNRVKVHPKVIAFHSQIDICPSII